MNPESLNPNDSLIQIGGGTYIKGGVQTEGDFVGRDQNIHGDIIRGDKIGRDKYEAHYHYQHPSFGIPFQAPPLPTHFIPRPEITNALKTHLLINKPITPGILVVSAIHGLGGIGKSTLAAALAYDPEVQLRFKNGILWATLGQQPDLLSLLSGWVQALGDHDFHPTTIEAVSTHLRTLLQDKAILLVVDDVWQPDHAKPFRVGGPKGQILITTRRADVADEVGAELHQMDVMTPEQSLALLTARLGRPLVETEQAEALTLAKDVGYLPLALELAAARVARGTTWTDLCEALEAEIARLEALEGPRQRRERPRLEASFNLSLNALRAEDETAWRAFVWLGVLPEDASIVAPMVATLWEMSQADGADILELLWNDALLLPAPPLLIGERKWSTYRLHDLLHDMARRLLTAAPPQGLGYDLLAAHATLLEHYHKRTQNGLWHTLPDDSYIHTHLTWHMEQSGQVEQIHALLREETPAGQNGWYQACEQLGQTVTFLEDVARAWRLAEKKASTLYTPQPFPIGLPCRYALIIASLNSLAQNIPPVLLAALVMNGLWAPTQALIYAYHAPNLEQRAASLSRLIPYLPEPLNHKALTETLEILHKIWDLEMRVQLLAEMVPHLPSELMREALAVAQEIERESYRVEALRTLIPYLSDELLIQTLVLAKEIREQNSRVHLLVSLVPYLPMTMRNEVLQDALSVARNIWREDDRVQTIVRLIPHSSLPLRERLLQDVLETVRKTKMEKHRVRLIIESAPYLSPALLNEAVEITRNMQREYYRVEALAGLIPYLAKSLQEESLKEILKVLRVARNIVTQTEQRWITHTQFLKTLSPRLAKLGYPQEALDIVQSIEGEEERIDALIELVPYLPEPFLDEVLSVVFAVENLEYRANTLVKLIPYLPQFSRDKVLEMALTTIRAIESEYHQREMLTKLTPYLSKALLVEVLVGHLPCLCIFFSDFSMMGVRRRTRRM